MCEPLGEMQKYEYLNDGVECVALGRDVDAARQGGVRRQAAPLTNLGKENFLHVFRL